MKIFFKQIPFLFTMLLFISCANSYSTKTAKLSDKVMIYDIKRKGCPACAYQEQIFKDKGLQSLLKKYCKVIYVDVSEQNRLPKDWMRSNKTPTVHFVDSNYNKLIPTIHSVNDKEFKEAILKAKEALDKELSN